MELHYIWINDFNFLKKRGINLSSQFIFKMSEIEEGRKKLRIGYNPDYIPNFFEAKNISNVTTIVGQNGTGKSSILEYIKNRLPSGINPMIDEDIFAYSAGNKKELIVLSPTSIDLDLDDETGLFRTKKYDQNAAEGDPVKLLGEFSDVDYIYYSFFLDYKTEVNSFTGLKNISTAALLAQAHFAHFNRDKTTKEVANADVTNLDALMASEIGDTMLFLVNRKDIKLPFTRPEELIIYFDRRDIRFLNSQDGRKPLTIGNDIINFVNDSLQGIDDLKEDGSIIAEFHLLVLANFIVYMNVYFRNSDSESEFKLPRGLTIVETVKIFFANIVYHRMGNGELLSNPIIQNKCKIVLRLLEIVGEMVYDNKIKTGSASDNKDRKLLLPIGKDSEEDFEKFMVHYLQSKGRSGYLEFKWRNLSTGQQSMLSFFSRIYGLVEGQGAQLKKTVVLLIDEGDAGFHPEWQREFFINTIKFISKIFDKRSVQLIFTTNTPFLTSDLTNPHIIFLERNKATGEIIIHEKDVIRGNTFGANIHELFANSFYMDGVLMGDFAKKRINDIIKFLKDKKKTVPREDYRKTISLIGEPILRRKLQGMWIEKFNNDEESILLERLRVLRKEKGKKP